MKSVVRVGVGVIILKDNKILLGERIGAHGANTWATPGGHLEFGENVDACAKREVLEETGLRINAIENLDYTNDVFASEDKHYITLFVVAHDFDGEVSVKEPNKCKQWQWFDLDNLPDKLFLPLTNFLKAHTQQLYRFNKASFKYQKDISDLFDKYTLAFNTLNSELISENYMLPCAINDADGQNVYSEITCLNNKFELNIGNLKELSYQNAAYQIKHIKPMGDKLASVDIAWLVKTEKLDLEFSCLYICHETSLGWKIFNANVYSGQ